MWIVIAAGIAAIFLFTFKRVESAETMTPINDAFEDIFQRYAKEYGLDPYLLRAIAMVESSLNPLAENPKDPSVGLMQVLCKPDANGRCTNVLHVDDWESATWEGLKDPDFNVRIAGQILAWNLRTYGYPRGIAVYNSWDSRRFPLEGPFPNQAYVDKVIATYTKLTT
jgi:soluble lytic murein transglycosylase-like protein